MRETAASRESSIERSLETPKTNAVSSRKKRSGAMSYWTFVGPAVLFFLLVQIIPFTMGIYYSFTSWNGVSSTIEWVGLSNYRAVLSGDGRFGDSFGFTAKFTLVAVVITNVVAFGLALALNAALKTKNVLRTVFFLPNVIGGLLLGFIWQFIFIRGFATVGAATSIPFFQLPWLGDANTAFWGIVIVFVWQTSGYMMVIYIAALQGVDASVLEAAKIDGAGGWLTLRKIIIPLILPSFTICLFLTTSGAFKIYDLNVSLTGGGPFQSTQSVALNIYQEAFTNNKYGLGSAKSIVFFLVVAAITTLQVALTKRREVEA